MYQHILNKGTATREPQTTPKKNGGDHAAPAKARPHHGQRACSWPGCEDGGDHRAPKSRDELTQYHWFCLDHVRVYNKAWNYYAGLSEDEVEREVRRDTTWNRPSWPLGGKKIIDQIDGIDAWIRDVGLDGDTAARRAREASGVQSPGTPDPVVAALDILDLVWPVDATEVKSSYKDLVKRHHPDTNGGDKKAEERFKKITSSYKIVMEFLDS